MNSTFITLVPKKHYFVKVKDSRPINLISGVLKIITSLSLGLCDVLGNTISPSECAFVPGW